MGVGAGICILLPRSQGEEGLPTGLLSRQPLCRVVLYQISDYCEKSRFSRTSDNGDVLVHNKNSVYHIREVTTSYCRSSELVLQCL